MIEWLTPEWPAARQVRALSTTRVGGCSAAPFDSLNLGQRSGDDAAALAANLQRLALAAALPGAPRWLTQVHGDQCADLDDPALAAAHPVPEADAAVTRSVGTVCVIQSADCLPVLFAARDGSCVGAAHAGWRGLAAGVLECTVAALRVAPGDLLAWLGPAIGPEAFEVGDEVRAAFVARDADATQAFVRNGRGRWCCDLFTLARQRLAASGIASVYGGGVCTHGDARRFFSYRRDGRTGRMASLIWLTGSA